MCSSDLVEDLQAALAADALTVVYQPVVMAGTGRICGVEALARWHNKGVAVGPDVFVRLAEEMGLIALVGASVMAQVVRDSAAIRAAADDVTIAVNVSPTQLCEASFADGVRTAVEQMDGSRLVLEITEREGISLDAAVLRTMQRVSDLGVVFAIDDFGVGFSSISYLQRVPAGIVKIDATLVADIDRDDTARELLRSMSIMSGALGLDIVVEGVERESQLAVVREDMPDAFAQGYFLHRPMPLADLLVVLAQDRDRVLGSLAAGTPSG